MLRLGWRLTPRTWWNWVTKEGSLHQARVSVASCLAAMFPGGFEVYGPGWDRLDNQMIAGAWRGPWLGSKLDLLGRFRFNIAYENCANDCGYISEKIFDAYLSGTVPVYLGNRRIEKLIPPESFVDVRNFKNLEDLGAYLGGMPRKEWEDLRIAGDHFIRNDALVKFGAKQYADAVISALRGCLKNT